MKPDSLKRLAFLFSLCFFFSFVNRDERLYTIHHSRHERPYHGLRFCVLFEQIGVAVFRYALRGRRTVDQIDVSAVRKFQDSVCVFRVKFSDFVHHAVELEFAELARCLRLENVDEHNVHHRFHEHVRAFGADIRNFITAGIVVVFLYAELQTERIAEFQLRAVGFFVQRFHELQ